MALNIPSNAQVFALVLVGVVAAPAALAQAHAVTIDPTTRTVTTSTFAIKWNTGVDTEAITSLSWMGGSNLTNSNAVNTCGNADTDVEYFGNSEAPPDPQSGGKDLVGGGTITPAGTAPWSAQILAAGTAQITINSNSTNCPPSSAGIDVQTTYRFFDSGNSSVNWFGVQRVFNFTETPFPYDFPPYVARLGLSYGYSEVLYPDTGGALVVMDVSNCGGGCSGPEPAPGAALLSPPWASTQGWFAFYNPTTQQGLVVKRRPSADPEGDAIAAQLWVDYDLGSNTNASSFLLMNPAAGFQGGLVIEVETLCFFNSTIWIPSLTPPAGCVDAPVNVSPWALTFAGLAVGVASEPQTATVTNVGTGVVTIEGITASGDFTQTNNCPKSIAAGASCTISVVFKPSATGIRSGSVSILDFTGQQSAGFRSRGTGLGCAMNITAAMRPAKNRAWSVGALTPGTAVVREILPENENGIVLPRRKRCFQIQKT